MNWLQQAFHVAKKDLRMSRWFLVLYVFVVLAAIPAALGENQNWATFAPLFVMLSGVIYTAFVVQADSAYRHDAYWASKPLYRTAVWAAKVLFVLAVPLLIVVAARSATLFLGFDVRGAALFAQIRESAMFYSGLLLLTFVLASLTPDLRTLFLTGMLYLVLSNVLGYLAHYLTGYDLEIQAYSASMVGVSTTAIMAVTVAIMLLLPAHVYAARTRRIAIGVIIVETLVMMFLPGERAGSGVSEPSAHSLPPVDIPTPVLHASRYEGLVDNAGDFNFIVQLDGRSDQYLYVLGSAVAELRLADGNVERIDSIIRPRTIGNASPPDIARVTWNGAENSGAMTAAMQIPVTSRERELVLSRTATLILRGYIDVLVREEVFAIPAQKGSAVVKNGMRLKIQRIRTIDQNIRIDGITASLDEYALDDPARPIFDMGDHYALVNQISGRAAMLNSAGGSSTGTGIVIPSQSYSSIGSIHLETEPLESAGPVDPDAELLNGAKLVLYRWRRIGSFPAATELTFAPMRRQ